MAICYERINTIKNKLKVKMTVSELANIIGCGERTIFRHLNVINKENCGLRKFKELGETYYIIQSEKNFNFNQEIVKQLEKVKKNFSGSSAPEIKTNKLIDKLISSLQMTNPEMLKPEAISTDPDYVLDYGPFSNNNLQSSLVNRVLKAIHDGFSVRISYNHATSAQEKESLEIFPVKVILRMDTLYLVAGEIDKIGNQSFKNFLFENILSVSETNHPSPIFSFDSHSHYKYTFGKYTSTSEVVDISLLIKESSRWLQTQFKRAHFNPEISKRYDKQNNMIVDMKLRITPDFEAWLMEVANDVRILKPASLKEKIRSKLKEALDSMDE